jgi:tetratricopeptide (TPR) repeat protein
VRNCLEQTIAAEPDYADAWAALALVYADAYRFNFNDSSMLADPLARALELAQGAVARAPRSSRGYRALHLVYWFMQDIDQSLQAAEAGLALNPNDSELMAELGLRYCWRGMWDKGLPLLENARAYNPGQPDAYRMPLFLRAYLDGRFEEALAIAKSINLPDVIFTHVALAMVYGQLGDTEQAQAAVARILEFDAAYGDHVFADLHKRNIVPELITVFADGLRRAGLDVSV